jgi:polyribonucleotide nucleotidyltransferase
MKKIPRDISTTITSLHFLWAKWSHFVVSVVVRSVMVVSLRKLSNPYSQAQSDFPYMMRVVSETTTCNGSSSMASVCGSTMSLMDAGVPIKAMVAGVAMGMIYDEESGKYEILADIQAQEDFLGDMDFKVARTEKGITALQMDCKIAGLSMEVVIRSFWEISRCDWIYHGWDEKMSLWASCKELSPFAPFLLAVSVPEEKMREVIWKGGETIQAYRERIWCRSESRR